MRNNNDVDDSLTLFGTYQNDADAYIIKGVLETNGVMCVINDQLMSNLYGGIAAFGARLYVLRSQVELAKRILESRPLNES